LKESTLEFDWIILLWIISELMELMPPREGLETVYSLWCSILLMRNLTLPFSSFI